MAGGYEIPETDLKTIRFGELAVGESFTERRIKITKMQPNKHGHNGWYLAHTGRRRYVKIPDNKLISVDK